MIQTHYGLQGYSLEEIKKLCWEQLEAISEKNLTQILAGKTESQFGNFFHKQEWKRSKFSHLILLFVSRGGSDIWKCEWKHGTDPGEPVRGDFIQWLFYGESGEMLFHLFLFTSFSPLKARQ